MKGMGELAVVVRLVPHTLVAGRMPTLLPIADE